MARQIEEDRISIADALEMLQVSKSTLEDWIHKAKLRNAVNKQRFPDDMRQRFLTRVQVEQLAAAHRRQIATAAELDPLARLEAVDAALTERIEALETRVKALEDARSPADDDLPI
jgi:polyhydroxyalkanoate synthesis regulator phasin